MRNLAPPTSCRRLEGGPSKQALQAPQQGAQPAQSNALPPRISPYQMTPKTRTRMRRKKKRLVPEASSAGGDSPPRVDVSAAARKLAMVPTGAAYAPATHRDPAWRDRPVRRRQQVRCQAPQRASRRSCARFSVQTKNRSLKPAGDFAAADRCLKQRLEWRHAHHPRGPLFPPAIPRTSSACS